MKNILRFIKKRWYLFVILLLIGVAYFYNQTTVSAKKIIDSQYSIKRQTLRETLSLSGQVEADEHVVLRFQTSGRLAWVGVKEGDLVKKFQSLASLDQRELKKRLEKSLYQYAAERNSFEQSKDDNQRVGDQPIRENGDRMKRILENAQGDLSSSVIDVELTALTLEYSNLWSPIDGIVIRVDSKFPGVNITPTGAEFEILNPDTVYFSFTADQTEIIKLREGLIAELVFDSFPDETETGSIYYISYTPKEGETGTVYEGRIQIPNEKTNKLRLGMTGDVTFSLQEKNNVIAIPSNYVKTDQKGKYVDKLVNEKPVKTYIKVSSEIDGNYEVLKGLQENDSILIPVAK